VLRRVTKVAGGAANVAVALLVLLLIGTALSRLRLSSFTTRAPSARDVVQPQHLVTGAALPGGEGEGEKRITFQPADLLKEVKGNRDVIIVDIRSREEFARGHIPSAVNIPEDELHSRALDELPGSKLLVITSYACSNDEMSGVARDSLLDLGFANVAILRNGIDGWAQQGFEVETTEYAEPRTLYVSGQSQSQSASRR
jgi:rhodanese-related sulfurtransferase